MIDIVELIKKEYVKALTSKFAEDIESIVVVGSFANNTYKKSTHSNLNIITILKSSVPKIVREKLSRIIINLQKSFPNIYITKNIYFRDELEVSAKITVNDIKKVPLLVYVPESIMRIKDHGITIYGNDLKDVLITPNRETVSAYDEIKRDVDISNKKYSKMIKNPTLFEASRLVIEYSAKHYYYAVNKNCFNYNLLDKQMKLNVPNYMFIELLKEVIKLKKNDYMVSESAKQNNFMDMYFEFINFVLENDVDNVPLEYKSMGG